MYTTARLERDWALKVRIARSTEHFFPLFLDGLTIVCAGFFVKDFEVYFMAGLLDGPSDVVVGVNVVAVVLGVEGLYKYDATVAVLG